MQYLVKFGQNYLVVKMMSELNFQELLKGIAEAQEYLEMNSGNTFEELIDEQYESLGFAVGHVLGMRDCLMVVQQMLMQVMSGEEE